MYIFFAIILKKLLLSLLCGSYIDCKNNIETLCVSIASDYSSSSESSATTTTKTTTATATSQLEEEASTVAATNRTSPTASSHTIERLLVWSLWLSESIWNCLLWRTRRTRPARSSDRTDCNSCWRSSTAESCFCCCRAHAHPSPPPPHMAS